MSSKNRTRNENGGLRNAGGLNKKARKNPRSLLNSFASHGLTATRCVRPISGFLLLIFFSPIGKKFCQSFKQKFFQTFSLLCRQNFKLSMFFLCYWKIDMFSLHCTSVARLLATQHRKVKQKTAREMRMGIRKS